MSIMLISSIAYETKLTHILTVESEKFLYMCVYIFYDYMILTFKVRRALYAYNTTLSNIVT